MSINIVWHGTWSLLDVLKEWPHIVVCPRLSLVCVAKFRNSRTLHDRARIRFRRPQDIPAVVPREYKPRGACDVLLRLVRATACLPHERGRSWPKLCGPASFAINLTGKTGLKTLQ